MCTLLTLSLSLRVAKLSSTTSLQPDSIVGHKQTQKMIRSASSRKHDKDKPLLRKMTTFFILKVEQNYGNVA